MNTTSVLPASMRLNVGKGELNCSTLEGRDLSEIKCVSQILIETCEEE